MTASTVLSIALAGAVLAQVDQLDIPELDDVQVDAATQPTGTTLAAICSAYTHTGNRTATGTWPVFGTVAVDPRTIPLGSRLTISGFEGTVFRAEDRGGAIVGPMVDIFMPSYAQAISYGRRPCTVQVLR